MANQFVNLPVPAGNGVGASVDVSTFGASKSIVVGGDCSAQVTIEVNNDAGQAGGWAALKTFQNTGELVVDVACRWMRVRVSNYNVHVGGQATCDVGGTDDGTSFQALAAPVGNGAAASSNTSALGEFKTVQCGGQYRGTTIVEVSEDGSSWGQPFAFGSQSGGIKSLLVTAEFMRVRRVGVPKIDPGIPVVTVGACVPGGGGGGGGGVIVDRDGSVVVSPATVLDFIGTRVIELPVGTAQITPAAVFDNAAGPLDTNIRGARLTNQSPIDNTKDQITNFGSQDHLVDPAATGATGVGSTIGGGNDNSASGDGSTIPGGVANIASGEDSFAEGHGCQAIGPQSHAEGALTTASGPAPMGGTFPFGCSHAEGLLTVASGTHSHAEGGQTVASGNDSHAEGGDTVASGNHAHAEGLATHAIGDNSHAEGNQTSAQGDNSHAEGTSISAGGASSHAEGVGTQAAGRGSHAEGNGTIAQADFSHAEGDTTTASGNASHAEGLGTGATGSSASHAEGQSTLASASASHAEGLGTTASGAQSHAEGHSTLANAASAHAEGDTSQATGVASHAEGIVATASGLAAHAEGDGTTASGVAAHAQGEDNIASGDASHAEGESCVASGEASHAQGIFASATRFAQDAYSSGAGGFLVSLGGSQTSKLTMNGATPGMAINESVELGGLGGFQFLLEDDKAYTFAVHVVAAGIQAGPTRVSKGWTMYFNARRAAGLSVITGGWSGGANGDAAAADWTFVATIGAAPDRLVLTFKTGAIATQVNVMARVQFTEISFV